MRPEQTDRYLALLGLSRSATKEDVKRAFRDRIKQHHPDTAGAGTGPDMSEHAIQLIEAYQALKDGLPPPRFADTPQGQDYFRKKREEVLKARAQRRAARAQSDIYSYARTAGQRLYSEMFGGHGRPTQTPGAGVGPGPGTADGEPDINYFWDRLSDMVFGDGPETRHYGENISIHEVRKGGPASHTARVRPTSQGFAGPRTGIPRSGPSAVTVDDAGSRYFRRAEALLRDVVGRYDVQSELKRKTWVREYLAGLNNVQVLYRDVAARHPSWAPSATDRLRQISELARELRSMVR